MIVMNSESCFPEYLGNDVVDLSAPAAMGRGRDLRFIGKILTPKERKALESADDPDTEIWRYWAAKESAYKALARYHPGVSSVPGRYEVSWDRSGKSSTMAGWVRTPASSLKLECRADADKVWCICTGESSTLPEILMGVEEMKKGRDWDFDRGSSEHSHRVRIEAIRSMACSLKRDFRTIEIHNPYCSHGPSVAPLVTIDGHPQDIVLSLSHDGRYVFFAWCITTRRY
jgi:phosphopantetheinyl transferase (holo-ACP synthase)